MVNVLQFQGLIFSYSNSILELVPNVYSENETDFYLAFSTLTLQGFIILCFS